MFQFGGVGGLFGGDKLIKVPPWRREWGDSCHVGEVVQSAGHRISVY